MSDERKVPKLSPSPPPPPPQNSGQGLILRVGLTAAGQFINMGRNQPINPPDQTVPIKKKESTFFVVIPVW
jgi:hypothetical protein